MALDPLPTYDSICLKCKFWAAHKGDMGLTGYGSCSQHVAMQTKGPDDRALITGTPITWQESTCPLGEGA